MLWRRNLALKGEEWQYLPLLGSVFLIASCAIVYELMIGAASSYLLGDSVYQFSVTIGLFLTAMGVGSFLSRRVEGDLLSTFVNVELIIGLLGGISVPLLFYVYGYSPGVYQPAMYALIVAIGTLVGLEIPVVTRLLSDHYNLRANLANVLSMDYLGGLLGSLIFPIVLLPRLGLIATSLLMGLVSIGVAYLTIAAYRERLPDRRVQLAAVGIISALLAFGFVRSGPLWSFLEQRLYRDTVVFSAQTAYQQITVTQWRNDIRLFLDGNLQFSSLDEYRYHESLVHPAMSAARSRDSVLIMGGGDGLVAREVLKYPDVQQITLVDLDPGMVKLASENELLVKLNGGSLSHPKLRAVYQDAYKFIAESEDFYDVIIADLPDPRTESLQKLYSLEFYGTVKRRLAADGAMVTQATSPFFAPKAYWSVVETLGATFPRAVPYHADVPTFGDWGFVLAANMPLAPETLSLSVPTRFLDARSMQTLFVFGKDVQPAKSEANSILRPVILQYYREGWRGGR